MWIQAGTETYGRVKTVAGVSVVTKFATLNSVPLWPLRSFYRLGAPAGNELLPLISRDKTSVMMSYARAFFGLCLLIGAMVLVPAIMWTTGEHLDDFATTAAITLLGVLAVGIVGGLLSYVIPFTPRRELDVRRYCSEWLGIAIDPALVPSDQSRFWFNGIADPNEGHLSRGEKLVKKLVATRMMLAQDSDAEEYERQTDDLLEQLRLWERTAD